MAARPYFSLFGRSARSFLVPAKTASAVARRRGQGRPAGWRAKRASLDGDEHGRPLMVVGPSAPSSRGGRPAAALGLLAIGAALLCCGAAKAQLSWRGNPEIADGVEQASRRFGLPVPLIEAVIGAESAGNPRAVSAKGAMGLMQLMPSTWAALRADLALGDDPFKPHDNIAAGAAHLRRMLKLFGADGFLAAYNCGAGCYRAVLDGKRALPQETRNYVVRVKVQLGKAATLEREERVQALLDWRAATLFVGVSPARPPRKGEASTDQLFAAHGLEVLP